VAAAEAPERGYADVRALRGELCLQLGQGDVGNLGQAGLDQLGMGFGAARQPVAALRLGSGMAVGPAQPLPADGAGGTDAEADGCLSARQALIDGGQNTRAKVNRERLGHAGRPPSPAPTLNQISPSVANLMIPSARIPL
jgi:hypothetical protein